MATIDTARVPLHVSLIMDGNGRWARERGKERVYGHFEGVESVRACVEAAVEKGVRYLSLFAFSEEDLMKKMLDKVFEEQYHFLEMILKKGVGPLFRFAGLRQALIS